MPNSGNPQRISPARRAAAPAIGLLVCAVLAFAASRPTLAATGTSAGADIHFASETLNPQPIANPQTMRQVAPALKRIQPWISAVGAAVGVADLDGNGIDDDACLVDPRDDTVRVFKLPGTSSRLVTQTLRPNGNLEATAPMGCVPADINEDGAVDVIVYYWGRSPVIFYNNGAGRSFTPIDLVTPVATWNTTALNVADIDGDGHLDILVGNYFPDGARVLDPKATSDGRMEMQDSMSLARNAGENRLFLSHPDRAGAVSFTDASAAFPEESARAWTLAFGAQDLTHDGLPELYLANDFGPDQLLVNHSSPGHPRFDSVIGTKNLTTAKSSVLGRDSFKGMGVTFTHLDSNPDPSIFVSNITTPYALQESNLLFEPVSDTDELMTGHSPYRQNAEARGVARGGWAWDVKAADFNNDGTEEITQATGFIAGTVNRWPELQELAMSNDSLVKYPDAWLKIGPHDDISGHEPNRLWCWQPQGRYLDCGGTSGFGSTAVTRGFAVTDANGDGRADVLVANQWGPSKLLLNITATRNSAAWLRLVIPTANGSTRPAIGAAITLETAVGTQYRQLFPANGHAGVSSSEVSFGLGPAHELDRVPGSVTWRSESGDLHTQRLSVTAGHSLIVLNNDGSVTQR